MLNLLFFVALILEQCRGKVLLNPLTARLFYNPRSAAYVDTNLVGSGKVSRAAIVGIEHADVWASSPGYTVSLISIIEADKNPCHSQLSKEERDALVAAFKPGGLDAVLGSGVRLAGQKFFTVKTTPDRSIYVKKQVREGRHIVLCRADGYSG